MQGEKKFLSPLFFALFPSGKGAWLQTSRERRSLTLHTPKPCLAMINCPKSHCVVWFKVLFSLLLLVTMSLKAKKKKKEKKVRGVGGYNYTDDPSQHPALCSSRVTQGKLLGHWINCPSSSLHFISTEVAFPDTTSLKESLAMDINIFPPSFPSLTCLPSTAHEAEQKDLELWGLALRPKLAPCLRNWTSYETKYIT